MLRRFRSFAKSNPPNERDRQGDYFFGVNPAAVKSMKWLRQYNKKVNIYHLNYKFIIIVR